MKIYPSPHELRMRRKPSFVDIPVSHIEQEYQPKRISIEIQEKFSQTKDCVVVPYQTFPTDDFLLFDGSGNVANATLTYGNRKYTYMPPSFTEFEPTSFSYQLLLKKKLSYRSDRIYDLRVGVSKEAGGRAFAEQLIPLFGNAAERGICPANVVVNHGSSDASMYLASTGQNLDFLFLMTHDGKYVSQYDPDAQIDIHSLLESHANLWITVNNPGTLFSGSNGTYTSGFKYNTIYNKSHTFSSSCYPYRVADNAVFEDLPPSYATYLHSSIFSVAPVMVLEKPSKGYIIISHSDLFDHLSEHAAFVYDLMMYLYLRSYFEGEKKTLWITDEPVDYYVGATKKYNRTHPAAEISSSTDNAGCIVDSCDLLNITLDNPDVYFDHYDSNGFLYFGKLTKTDPIKDPNATSVYTIRNTVIQYLDTPMFIHEDSVSITQTIDEDSGKCYLTVHPFRSSSQKIVVPREQTFELKDLTKPYVLVALPVDDTNTSSVYLVSEYEYDPSTQLMIARAQVEFEGESISYDTRILGGGIPEKYTNYEMLDIGNLQGRPYRVGVSAIIKLPKEAETYQDRILSAIDTYKVAADKMFVEYI